MLNWAWKAVDHSKVSLVCAKWEYEGISLALVRTVESECQVDSWALSCDESIRGTDRHREVDWWRIHEVTAFIFCFKVSCKLKVFRVNPSVWWKQKVLRLWLNLDPIYLLLAHILWRLSELVQKIRLRADAAATRDREILTVIIKTNERLFCSKNDGSFNEFDWSCDRVVTADKHVHLFGQRNIPSGPDSNKESQCVSNDIAQIHSKLLWLTVNGNAFWI